MLNVCKGSPPSSVCIVGTHTLRQATNAAEFLKRAEKVIPLPDRDHLRQ
ncbi:hypothetical protein RBI80_01160 [Klebsiella variicola]|nr:hypothetical protein RBI80_01160 [Klebsiella variicola]